VAHGDSRTAYAHATSCGTCTSQTRTCNDGTLSGSYTATSCSVGSIGDSYGGGKCVGAVSGETLIVATADQASGTQWKTSNGVRDIANISWGDGRINDSQIPNSTEFPAFKVCKDLTDGGYTDWYLPARGELTMLYQNKDAIGGLSGTYYWASTEHDNDSGRIIYFPSWSDVWMNKIFPYYVRCVRRQ